MAQTLVWVRSSRAPEKGAMAFPIDPGSNRLMVDGIASYFGLDPTSLSVGRMVLLKDANGLSVMDANQIRQVSTSAGLGDGRSEETPIIITGTSASVPSRSAGGARTMLSLQAFKRKQIKIDHQRLREMSVRRYRARHDTFYKGNGLYSYSLELHRSMPRLQHINLTGEKVRKFVGSVHIIARQKRDGIGARQQQQEVLSMESSTGVVTLVKPNGVCLTAEACIQHEQGGGDEEVVIMVKFPHLGACYECRVADRQNAVAVLEPVESQSFDACMLVRLVAGCPFEEVLTFDSCPGLGVVPALTLDSVVGKETEPEVIIYPSAMVRQIGVPVFTRLGIFRGIVVRVDGSKLPRQQPRRKVKSLHGVELHVQSVRDLDQELKIRKRWHNTKKILLQVDETAFEFMSQAILQNQLVEYTFPVKFKTPIDEWEERHPLESFSTGLPNERHITPYMTRSRPRLPTKMMTKEELRAQFVKLI